MQPALTEAFLVLVRMVMNPLLLRQPMMLTSETFTKFHHVREEKNQSKNFGKSKPGSNISPNFLKETEFRGYQ